MPPPQAPAEARQAQAPFEPRKIEALPVEDVDLLVLQQAGIVAADALAAKVVLSGAITRKVNLRGVAATKGAKAAIEAAGGSVQSAE